MKPRVVFIGLTIALLIGWLLWRQVGARVLADKVAPSGEARILVREMQLHPLSITGLLRANERLYRCEYYPHPGWPMFSAETFSEESYVAQRIDIQWHDDTAATITIDKSAVLKCDRGHWGRSP